MRWTRKRLQTYLVVVGIVNVIAVLWNTTVTLLIGFMWGDVLIPLNLIAGVGCLWAWRKARRIHASAFA